MILETRHLELVAAVVDHGTLTSAAKQLHVTQPALSHMLSNLESRLRTSLFSRSGRRMVPTAAGLRMLAAARTALPHLRSAEEDLAHLVNGTGGTVRVSTECYTCYHWLPAVVRRITKRNPNLDVQVVADATRAPLDALREGRIDVAIATTTSPHFQAYPLFRDELVAVMPAEHPLARRPFLQAGDFADQHLILYDVPPAELTIYRDFLVPAGVVPKRASFIQLTEAIIEMVRANLGISVLARWAVTPAVTKGTLVAVPIGKPPITRQWNALLLKSARPPQHITAFAKALAEEQAWREMPSAVPVGTPRELIRIHR